MRRNESDSNPILLSITYFCTGNLRTNRFGKLAGSQILSTRNGFNSSSIPNLAASMNFDNRNKANWIADNYNYDHNERLPKTNFTLNRK